MRNIENVGVIGLGYVGLPLAVLIAENGYKVIGIDNNKKRVANINKGINYISDIEDSRFKNVIKTKTFKATCNQKQLKKCKFVIIAVPTPLDKHMQPDLSFIISAANDCADNISKGTTVVLESTTFPGTTEDVLLPIFKEKGFKAGKDIYIGFSPERVDPGNTQYKTGNTPKIVSGVTKECSKRVKNFYDTIISKTIPVSSPKVAELAKLLENIFRNVNIALVNELMLLSDRMNIDIWESIEAASTKPFGFMKFLPGPGVGGHCIPVDPFYLTYKAKEYNFFTNFISLSAEINENIPYFVLNKLLRILALKKMIPSKTRLLILGLAFKKDVDDMRNSPILKIIELLDGYGIKIIVHDPFVKSVKVKGKIYRTVKNLNQNIIKSDCILIHTNHTNYKWKEIVKNTRGFILDTRNATKGIRSTKIIKL